LLPVEKGVVVVYVHGELLLVQQRNVGEREREVCGDDMNSRTYTHTLGRNVESVTNNMGGRIKHSGWIRTAVLVLVQ
jgi:hypothetical protein